MQVCAYLLKKLAGDILPRTPKISNYVEGLRVHRTLKMSASVLALADKLYQENGLSNTSYSFEIDDTKQQDTQLASNAK